MVNVDTYTIHRTFGKGIPLDFSHGGGRNPPLPGSFILAAERSAARKGVLRIPGVAIRPGGFGKAWTVQVDGGVDDSIFATLQLTIRNGRSNDASSCIYIYIFLLGQWLNFKLFGIAYI